MSLPSSGSVDPCGIKKYNVIPIWRRTAYWRLAVEAKGPFYDDLYILRPTAESVRFLPALSMIDLGPDT